MSRRIIVHNHLPKKTAKDARPFGQRVKIMGGMKEFVGKTGTLAGKEGGQYRVDLDSPVNIPGVGSVSSDLWDGNLLQNLDAGKDKARDEPDYYGEIKKQREYQRKLLSQLQTKYAIGGLSIEELRKLKQLEKKFGASDKARDAGAAEWNAKATQFEAEAKKAEQRGDKEAARKWRTSAEEAKRIAAHPDAKDADFSEHTKALKDRIEYLTSQLLSKSGEDKRNIEAQIKSLRMQLSTFNYPEGRYAGKDASLSSTEQKRLEQLRIKEMNTKLSSKETDEMIDLVNKKRAGDKRTKDDFSDAQLISRGNEARFLPGPYQSQLEKCIKDLKANPGNEAYRQALYSVTGSAFRNAYVGDKAKDNWESDRENAQRSEAYYSQPKESPSARRSREMAGHQFSESIGGYEGNYRSGPNDAAAHKYSFDDWMKLVDAACQSKAGVSVHDLEDCPFRDWYDSYVPPANAATRCLRRSSGYAGDKAKDALWRFEDSNGFGGIVNASSEEEAKRNAQAKYPRSKGMRVTPYVHHDPVSQLHPSGEGHVDDRAAKDAKDGFVLYAPSQFGQWKAKAEHMGDEVVEMMDDSPNEPAGSGPWRAFTKSGGLSGEFDKRKGGHLQQTADKAAVLPARLSGPAIVGKK